MNKRRIVAKVEKLLRRVATAQARLATIPRTLKRFRQSVLATAFSGMLTREWRKQNPDTETGSELLTRIRRDRNSARTSFTGRRKLTELPKPFVLNPSIYCRYLRHGLGVLSEKLVRLSLEKPLRRKMLSSGV
jgi:hypothetical protein